MLAEGHQALIAAPGRFEGVKVIGVDEHVWRRTRGGTKYVTVIIDLTPIRDRTGSSRLLARVERRSTQASRTWLAERPRHWRAGVEVVAMDGFVGFTTATTEELPEAVAVMDPFHVVRLAGDALDRCRRRVQQDLHGHRGRKGDPLYRARRTLHTGADLRTDRQRQRRTTLFDAEQQLHVEATWGIYQRMIAAYPACILNCDEPDNGGDVGARDTPLRRSPAAGLALNEGSPDGWPPRGAKGAGSA